MNQKLFNVLIFTAGAAIGSLVTWKFVKDKYERIAQEEIESVKDTWARMAREEAEADEDGEDESEEDEDSDIAEYRKLADEYVKEGEGDDEVPYINGPYVITPEDFANGNYEHDIYCLTYYADGVLSNDWYEELDIDETIGEDSLEHFGDYTEDVVHVRNERLKADYEVTRDPRNYADMIANDPLMSPYAN